MIRTLDESKRILENALTNNNHVENKAALSDVLSFLETADVRKETLEETRIGKVVNEFRRVVSDADLSRRAKELVKSWRKLIPENGVKGATANSQVTFHSTGPSSPSVLNAQQRRSQPRVAPPSSPLCSSASSSPCLPSRANSTHPKALLSHVNNATKKTARPLLVPNNQVHKPASPAPSSFTAEQQRGNKLDTVSSHVVHPKPYCSPHHPSNQIKNSPHSLFNGTLTNQSSPKLLTHSYKFNGNHQFHQNHINKASSKSSKTLSNEVSPLQKTKECETQINISSKVISPSKVASAGLDANSLKGSKRKCESPSSLSNLSKDKKIRNDTISKTSSICAQSLGQQKSKSPALSKSCDDGTSNSKGSSLSSPSLNVSQQKPLPSTPKINKVKTTKEIIKDLYAKTPDTFSLSLVNKLSVANQSDSQAAAASSHSSNSNVPSNLTDLSRTSTSPCESALSVPNSLSRPAKKSVDDEIAEILSLLPPIDPTQIDWTNTEEAETNILSSCPTPQDLETQHLPGINGHFNKDGEWREFHQVLEKTSSDNNILLILPYVDID